MPEYSDIEDDAGHRPLRGFSDEELAARCQEDLPDDVEAYRELVRRYERQLHAFVRQVLGSEEDAEEVTQDVLVQVFRKVYQFEGRSTFKTWLYQIVNNMCHRRLSKVIRKREVEEEYREQVEAVVVDGGVVGSGPEQRIEEILGQMGEMDREVLVCKFVSGMTLQEIADVLGIGLSAAKMRYYRALEVFKELYDGEDSCRSEQEGEE